MSAAVTAALQAVEETEVVEREYRVGADPQIHSGSHWARSNSMVVYWLLLRARPGRSIVESRILGCPPNIRMQTKHPLRKYCQYLC